MKFFKDMSYKLDRTFAITLAVAGVFLYYIGFIANRNNTAFFIFGTIMFILMIYFIVLGVQAYRHPIIHIREDMQVYTSVCPKCNEMVSDEDKICPYCSHSLK